MTVEEILVVIAAICGAWIISSAFIAVIVSVRSAQLRKQDNLFKKDK